MDGYRYSFEKLDVWQEAREYVSHIYSATKHFPIDERFALSTQLQRAAISVVSNIAEGISRKSDREKLRFIEIAYGSLMEVYCQLCIAFDLHYIDGACLEEHKAIIDKISNKLNALSRVIGNRIG